MRTGVAVIVQAPLVTGLWGGRADILRRVERPSLLGSFWYEPLDTKLSAETKGGTILQLCTYAEMLGTLQGAAPERFHVVTPGQPFTIQTYRFDDYRAYLQAHSRAPGSSSCRRDARSDVSRSGAAVRLLPVVVGVRRPAQGRRSPLARRGHHQVANRATRRVVSHHTRVARRLHASVPSQALPGFDRERAQSAGASPDPTAGPP